jgi:excisionase family DNA binding protein
MHNHGDAPVLPSSVQKQGTDNLELSTKQEVANVLRVSLRTLDSWIASHRIPFYRFSARCIRFDLDEVRQALTSYRVKEVRL